MSSWRSSKRAHRQWLTQPFRSTQSSRSKNYLFLPNSTIPSTSGTSPTSSRAFWSARGILSVMCRLLGSCGSTNLQEYWRIGLITSRIIIGCIRRCTISLRSTSESERETPISTSPTFWSSILDSMKKSLIWRKSFTSLKNSKKIITSPMTVSYNLFSSMKLFSMFSGSREFSACQEETVYYWAWVEAESNPWQDSPPS